MSNLSQNFLRSFPVLNLLFEFCRILIESQIFHWVFYVFSVLTFFKVLLAFNWMSNFFTGFHTFFLFWTLNLIFVGFEFNLKPFTEFSTFFGCFEPFIWVLKAFNLMTNLLLNLLCFFLFWTFLFSFVGLQFNVKPFTEFVRFP